LDTSNAISNVEECRKFLFPFCKFLVAHVAVPDLSKTEQQPEEPKKEQLKQEAPKVEQKPEQVEDSKPEEEESKQ